MREVPYDSKLMYLQCENNTTPLTKSTGPSNFVLLTDPFLIYLHSFKNISFANLGLRGPLCMYVTPFYFKVSLKVDHRLHPLPACGHNCRN